MTFRFTQRGVYHRPKFPALFSVLVQRPCDSLADHCLGYEVDEFNVPWRLRQIEAGDGHRQAKPAWTSAPRINVSTPPRSVRDGLWECPLTTTRNPASRTSSLPMSPAWTIRSEPASAFSAASRSSHGYRRLGRPAWPSSDPTAAYLSPCG
jgi:hypothetical protein